MLLFYGAGAYMGGALSIAALVVGIGITSLTALALRGAVASNLIWDDIVIAALPWFVGRMMRDRSARARAARERAEQLDSEHECTCESRRSPSGRAWRARSTTWSRTASR